MSDVITVTNLGKKYKRYRNRAGRLLEWVTGGRLVRHQALWVLRGLSFQVSAGEGIGIVGQNGAGKSTLLKILTGATQQTEGTFQIHGKVASLLELGMGFHLEFTGRQNAFTACQIMGMAAGDIHETMPGIVEFSELADYIDEPLRTYSSGMQMRLAFSVATAFRPEVLIVDEALSVGDAYFAHKSAARIRKFKEQGTTLLFVSHDPGAIKTLCDRALLLERGVLLREGSPAAVLDYYNATIAKKERDQEIVQVESDHGRARTRSGSKKIEIESVELLDARGNPARAFRVSDRVHIRCVARCHEAVSNATVGILIRDRLGSDVFGTNTFHLGQPIPTGSEAVTVDYQLQLNLGVGSYTLTVAAHTGPTHIEDNLDWWDNVLVFQMVPGEEPLFTGLVSLPVHASVRVGSDSD